MKNFTLTGEPLTDFQLVLEQIDTVSTVELNDFLLNSTSSMFFPYTFSLTQTQLKVGSNNTLKIQIRSPIEYALQQAVNYPYYVPPNCTDSQTHGECHFQFIRKEACSFSWGWGPAFAPMGITGDIYLQAIDSSTQDMSQTDFHLCDVNVKKVSNDDEDSWIIDFQLKFEENPCSVLRSEDLYFRLINTSWSSNTTLSCVNNYQSPVPFTVRVPSHYIALWYPHTIGQPILYEFQVECYSQIKTKQIGFRTIELIQDPYTDLDPDLNGTSFYFKVNNQTLFIKGSNWIPADSFQERITQEYLEVLLKSAAEANINMLRVWGGGLYEKKEFYELADQLGIMIWQDFMFSDSL
ncbi:unnamed protein product [Didymodactylos carnosus]|uniref:beta-mannosidase n=1 Tax=Didymodactylos carnosus TaxID=1234261 RepID=A0A8S2GZN9_9BILA|nr:unnamed protein product [Didymodactylos carnosus]CAF3583785.1 unnamed protein product [Didymodactylos carnosus]